MMGDVSGNQPGIHAEHDAINGLKPLRRKKHLQNVNILVVRLSKNNRLQNSKPCANCIETMNILPEKKGYRIKNVYYSNENGEIVKSNLKILENEELHYSRFFRRNRYSL
jgi:cytidine deaminase